MSRKFLGSNKLGKPCSIGFLFLLVFIFGFTFINSSQATEKSITIGPAAPDTGRIIMGVAGSKVGIGSDPGLYNLFVNGSVYVSGTIASGQSLQSIINASNISSGAFGSNAGGGNFSFPGNLGIGVTNPNTKLDVNGQISYKAGRADNLVQDPQFAETSNWWGYWGSSVTFISSVLPNGTNVTAARTVTPSDGNAGFGLAQSVKIDPKKNYRVSVWMKGEGGGTGGTKYFGVNAYNASGGEVGIINTGGTGVTNPYFHCGGLPGNDGWYKITAYIFSSDTPLGWSTPPDVTGNGCNVSPTGKFDSSTNTLSIRFYNYSYGAGQQIVQFALPTIEEVSTENNIYAVSNNVVIGNNQSVGIGFNSPGYKLDVNGNGAFRSGDNSYLYFGPNASWAGNLYIGATGNKAGTKTAQVIATDGNLHIDSGTSNAIYLNYYSAGADINVFGNMYLNTRQIHSLGTPTTGTDAATKSYVDSAMGSATDSTKVAKAGDTMSGALLMNGNPISLSDGKLYLRTNGDTNHYLWNNDSDWEELIAYNGTGFKVTSSVGNNMLSITASNGDASFRGTVTAPTFSGNLSGTASDSDKVDGWHRDDLRAWSNLTGRPGWLSDGSYIENLSDANSWANSGFYQNGGCGSNYPSCTWYNMLNIRHSNQGNYHGFQIAMSYYDNNLWFRSYQGSGSFQPWVYAISSGNIGSQSVAYAADAGTTDGQHLGTANSPTFQTAYVNKISHPNGEIYLGGNLHIDSYNGNDIYMNYYSSRPIRMYGALSGTSLSMSGDVNSSAYVYGNELYSRDNLYLGYLGWISNFLNQNVRSDAVPTFSGVITNNAMYLNGISVNTGNSSLIINNQYADAWAVTSGIPNVSQAGFSINKVNGYTYGANIQYGTSMFVIDSANNVGIGLVNPSAKLEVSGDIKAGSFIYNSDRNLKYNIENIQSPLEKIMQLRGVTFNWKDTNKPGLGLIAQEVEQVFPELVTGVDGKKGVQYGNLVAPLIEAVKQQQNEISYQDEKINNLNATVQSLSDQLKELQKRINKR